MPRTARTGIRMRMSTANVESVGMALKNSIKQSFRGAAAKRGEPGIQRHYYCEMQHSWIPGPALRAVPE